MRMKNKGHRCLACENEAYSLGLCPHHYRVHKKYGYANHPLAARHKWTEKEINELAYYVKKGLDSGKNLPAGTIIELALGFGLPIEAVRVRIVRLRKQIRAEQLAETKLL